MSPEQSTAVETQPQTAAQPHRDRVDIPVYLDEQPPTDNLDNLIPGSLPWCLETIRMRGKPKPWLWSAARDHFLNTKVAFDTGVDEPTRGRVIEVLGDESETMDGFRLRVLLHRGKTLILPMTFAMDEHIWAMTDGVCGC